MKTYTIDVVAIEVINGHHTLWVHGKHGTVIRIKSLEGKVKVDTTCRGGGPHCDIEVVGDINICIPTKKRKKKAHAK